jgi:hypothetical protein
VVEHSTQHLFEDNKQMQNQIPHLIDELEQVQYYCHNTSSPSLHYIPVTTSHISCITITITITIITSHKYHHKYHIHFRHKVIWHKHHHITIVTSYSNVISHSNVTSHQGVTSHNITAQVHACLKTMEMEIFTFKIENTKLRTTKQTHTHPDGVTMVQCAVTDKGNEHRTAELELELALSIDRGGVHCIAVNCIWILFNVIGHVWM